MCPLSESVSDVPAPHSSSPQEPRVPLPTLADKVNRQQVLVYVLLAQLLTFAESVLPELSFVTVGFWTRLHTKCRFNFFFSLLDSFFCSLNVLNFNSDPKFAVAPRL